MEKQNQIVKIYVSESEKNKIINQSNQLQLSVSEYAKKILIKGPVILNITVNDLLDYSWQIYEASNKIQELLAIISRSNDATDTILIADNIKKILTEINSNCNAALKINYDERKKIYYELEDQIKNLIF